MSTPPPINASLEWKLEEAARLWLLDTGVHGFNINGGDTKAPDVRHHDAAFDTSTPTESEKLPTLTLPAIILKATREKQLHTQVAVWLCRLEIRLDGAADDLTDAIWQGYLKAIEDIFSVMDLAGYLTTQVDGFTCLGVVERAPARRVIIERHWSQALNILLYCQPANR